ncbi:hypothetical protein MPLB_1870049 [Mesorhizobium sp. ORS 3324]|nr:hypothetical protein MPLB_1870049 [Mesorhizobium sp. ORS 3324]
MMPGSKRQPAARQSPAGQSKAIKTDLLARACLDILAREEGVHSKSMLRAGSGDPSDPAKPSASTHRRRRLLSERPDHQRILLVVAEIAPQAICPPARRCAQALLPQPKDLNGVLRQATLDHDLLQPARPASGGRRRSS